MNISLHHQWESLRLKAQTQWEKTFAPRYEALGESEQRTVRIAAIVLPIIIFIFGILLPALDKHTMLSKDINKLSAQVAEAKQLAKILAENPRKQTKHSANNNILSDVDKLARQAGVRTFMTRLRPQQMVGGKQRLQTQIKSAPYQKFIAFLDTLEGNGYNVNQLKIQAAGKGLVHAQASIGK